jgi:predicted Zn-dependent peptidase
MVASHKNLEWKSEPEETDLTTLIETELHTEPFDCKKTEVDNVPVYIKHISTSPCIHIRIGFRYGAMHDQLGKEGTAHFLEHMLFDGSDSEGVTMFADEKETQEFGKVILLDSLNAHTSFLELFVTGKCLPHNFDLALKGIMSMIIEPKLTEKAFEHEKKVITQEAWGVFLNEKRLAYIRKERENRFYDLPNRVRIASALGWPETVLALTHADIVTAHKMYFVKENMEVYIAGNIDTLGGSPNLIDILSTYINRMPSGSPTSPAVIPSELKGPKIKVFDHTYEEIGLAPREQASINVTAISPRINKQANSANTPEENQHLAALYMTGELLSDLVFRKLRLDNSWCYGAGAGSSNHIDHLALNMGGTIDYHYVDEALTILKQLLKDVQSNMYAADFYKTKKLIVENSIARERTTQVIADRIMDQVRLDGEIVTLKDMLLEINKVTFADIQHICATYFTPDKTFTEIIRPAK